MILIDSLLKRGFRSLNYETLAKLANVKNFMFRPEDFSKNQRDYLELLGVTFTKRVHAWTPWLQACELVHGGVTNFLNMGWDRYSKDNILMLIDTLNSEGPHSCIELTYRTYSKDFRFYG